MKTFFFFLMFDILFLFLFFITTQNLNENLGLCAVI